MPKLDEKPLEQVLSGFLTDCDGSRTGYSNNITAAIFAVAQALI